MPAPKKRPARKAAAKKRPARRTNSRGGRGRKSKGPSSGILIFLLVVSMSCLGVSVFMLLKEKQGGPATSDLDRKAQKLARDHPDAEVFNLDDPVKKKP